MTKIPAITFVLLLTGGEVVAQQYLITTVAGGGVPTTPVSAANSAAFVDGPLATGPDGAVYYASTYCVFRIDIGGILTRVAGSSDTPGYSGDGGMATSARLNPPSGLAVDAAGNVYIADAVKDTIRKVAAGTGVIATVAGTGTAGYSGDGGPATSAQFNQPKGVAVDSAGNLYVADSSNNVVRKIAAATGVVTTVAGSGTQGSSGDGGPATAAQLGSPTGIAVTGAGDIYVLDAAGLGDVRKVAASTGAITTVIAGTSWGGPGITTTYHRYPAAIAVDGAGDLFIAQETQGHIESYGAISKIAAATGATAQVYGPVYFAWISYMAVDGSGNVYFGSSKLAPDGTVTALVGPGSLYSGNGGPATSARLLLISGVVLDGSGNLFLSDQSACVIWRVSRLTGIITTVAGTGTCGYSGDGGPATSAQLYEPGSVAFDGAGNLCFTDLAAGGGAPNVVRKIAAGTGIITLVAGNATVSNGFSGDGGPATSADIEAEALAVDRDGNLYIAANPYWHPVVRKVTAATGIITTVAGNGTAGYSGDGGQALSAQIIAWDIALDAAGNLYIAGTSALYTGGGISVVRKVTAATGIITTVAGTGRPGYSGDGGPATGAQISGAGIALDGAGNLFIADLLNYVIRKVAAATGVIATVAGNGTQGYSGDGGPALSATFNSPRLLAADAAGNVYVVDNSAANIALSGSSVVRLLVPATDPLLSVASTHSANFTRGQTDAYSVVVSNAASAAPTNGPVTVTETLTAGLTLASLSGEGWACSGNACTRSDALGGGASYPAINVTVSVAADAPSQATNQVVVAGGGSLPASAGDLTTIVGPPAPPILASPANGSGGVVRTPGLNWSPAAGATSYDVYFGTLSTPPLVASTTQTNYIPGVLDAEATYYWQVVARNDSGTASSETWSFTTGATVGALRFVPVPPCRVADTRFGSWPFGAPTMTGNSKRDFPISQGGCNVPATAVAYSLNVTAVPEGYLGYLTVWPTGQPRPGVSTLNSWEGTVVANAAIVPAGTGGAVSVYVSDNSDVILDIDGYFDSSEGPTSYAFYPATPCRVADTRGAAGQFGGPSMDSATPRDFPIPLSGCSIPPTARGYSLNFTVVPSGYLGFLSTWPTGQSQPNVSTLNSWTGKVVANAAIVPAGTNESVSVYVSNPTNVILDVNGYFGAPAGAGALSFYPVTPCRIADTRGAVGPFGGPEMGAGETRSFSIPASTCNIPTTAAAYSLNVTVVPDGYLGYLSAWPAGSSQPLASTLNAWDGAVVANAAIVPAGASGAITIFVTNPTHVILDINGYFAPLTADQIATQQATYMVSQMTPAQKLQLVVGALGPANDYVSAPNGAGGWTRGIPELGIPDLYYGSDSLGVTAKPATALPSSIASAATWDLALAYQWGSVIGAEASAYGLNVSTGGNTNMIGREPRDGRTFETSGEDPILAGKVAAAHVRAVQAQHVIGCVKHYAFNDQETGRTESNVIIDERGGRESDLLAFEIAVKDADVQSVMCSYNLVNWSYSCENGHILTDVLKTDWGFTGFVMSDWWALPAYGPDATVSAALAGLDQEQPDNQYFNAGALEAAVQSGQVPQARVDDMVTRVLHAMYRVGVFGRPAAVTSLDPALVAADEAIAQTVEEQGAVLLKNAGGQLPLNAASLNSIAVIGSHADIGVLSGGGSAQVHPTEGVALYEGYPALPGWAQVMWDPSSPLHAIRAAAPNAIVRFDPGVNPSSAAALAASSNVAIVFVSQWASEGMDLPSLNFTDVIHSTPIDQDALVTAVAAANPHTIVVMENGGAQVMPWLGSVSAVLEAWFPGIRGAQAIANILFGSVNPSGKLPITFPAGVNDLPRPVIPGSPHATTPFVTNYSEGLLVGYKWYDVNGYTPAFPFGFGLSYTTFQFSNVALVNNLTASNPNFQVTFTVQNTGSVTGAEVAQVYLALPAGTNEPPKRLVGWQKVLLTPGQQQSVTVEVDENDSSHPLSYWASNSNSWLTAPGTYTVYLGNSAAQSSLQVAGTFQIGPNRFARSDTPRPIAIGEKKRGIAGSRASRTAPASRLVREGM